MITCNEKEVELSDGSIGLDLVQKLHFTEPAQAIGISINGKMSDFSDPIHSGNSVEIFHFDSKQGKEVFWHTSAHLLAQAILRIWPNAKPTIGPPIENGFYYDFANLSLSEEDFPKIEQEIENVLKENLKPKKYIFKDKKEALERFKENPYKVELIEDLPDDAQLTAYEQGDFFDLCRGPHLSAVNKIKAVKLLKTSAAYWRGDNEREMLTRIYAISFPSKKELKEYLELVEEAKKRDHRVVGTRLGLFSFFDVAPGMPLFQPNGIYIWNRLLEFWRELHRKNHYVEIKTPIMMDKRLWEQSGHWANYRQNMYTSEIDERVYAIKPMNCPGCMMHFGSKTHSYRDLPLRIAEIGTVHRHELSGSLSGLLRVRCFTQDDAHIFMRPTDIQKEIFGVLQLVDTVYSKFGLKYHLELSTRPEKDTIGSDEDWIYTTKGLQDALDQWGAGYRINAGDGAFYGPKIDCHVTDAIGRSWQCGTIQLDMSLPERFNLKYTDSDGMEKRPIMIHRVIFGSIERFFAILVEHFAGRFPTWLNPRAVRIISVADRHVNYAKTIQQKIFESGIPCELDETSESVSKKIRLAQMDQVSYMLTIGDKECETETISLRTRDNVVVGNMILSHFLSAVENEIKERALSSPFSKIN
jgi:threonyl-tRNA synthetase